MALAVAGAHTVIGAAELVGNIYAVAKRAIADIYSPDIYVDSLVPESFKRPRLHTDQDVSGKSSSSFATMAGHTYTRTRTTVRRRRRYKKKASIGRIAYRKVRALERAIEPKTHYTQQLTSTNMNPNAIYSHELCTPGVAAGAQSRIGSRVMPKWLTINLAFRNLSASNPSCIRIVVLQCKGMNPSGTGAEAYFAFPSGGQKYISPKNTETADNFKTLYDNIVTVSPGISNHLPVLIRCKALYEANFTSVPVTGQLWMMIIRDAVGVAADVQYHFMTKCTYIDL